MSFTDTGCRYSPRHLIISSNFQTSSSTRPRSPLLLLLSLLHDDAGGWWHVSSFHRTFLKKKKKKVSIENESHVENDWQTNNKNFRTVSSTVRRTVRQFYYPTRHAFVSLLVSLLLHTRDCFAGSRGKFSTIPPTFALTRPTCSTCFQSDTRASFFHSRPFQTRKIRCTLFRRFRLVYGYYRTCYEGEICE